MRSGNRIRWDMIRWGARGTNNQKGHEEDDRLPVIDQAEILDSTRIPSTEDETRRDPEGEDPDRKKRWQHDGNKSFMCVSRVRGSDLSIGVSKEREKEKEEKSSWSGNLRAGNTRSWRKTTTKQ